MILSRSVWVRNERFIGSEYCIGVDVLVVGHVESGDGFAVSRCADEKVNMSRTPAMPSLRADHVANGSHPWESYTRAA